MVGQSSGDVWVPNTVFFCFYLVTDTDCIIQGAIQSAKSVGCDVLPVHFVGNHWYTAHFLRRAFYNRLNIRCVIRKCKVSPKSLILTAIVNHESKLGKHSDWILNSDCVMNLVVTILIEVDSLPMPGFTCHTSTNTPGRIIQFLPGFRETIPMFVTCVFFFMVG